MGSETSPVSAGVMPADQGVPEIGTPTATPGEMPATTTTPSSPEELATELAKLKAALKKANDDAAKHRHANSELTKYKTETEAAKLSEAERQEKNLTDLQSRLAAAELAQQQERITSAIAIQAAQMGINPSLASRLVDTAQLEFDDNGKPTNVKDVLAAAVKEFGIQPAANGTARSTAGGATNPARSASNQAHIDREFVAKLTPQQYATLTPAQKQEVQAVMQSSSKVRGH
jgi:hypothetical protein